MADEAPGRDLESVAGSTSGGSVYGSRDRDSASLASPSAANRTRSYERAAGFKTARLELDCRLRGIGMIGTQLVPRACMQIAGVGMTAPQHVDSCGLSCW